MTTQPLQDHSGPQPPRRAKRWPWIVGIIAAFVVGLVVGVASNTGTTQFASSGDDSAGTATVTVTQTEDAVPTGTDTPDTDDTDTPDTDTDTTTTDSTSADIPGDGTYTVGDDIQPGTYHSTGGDGCSWERFGQDDSGDTGIVESGSSRTVTIRHSDTSFQTEGCGSWTRVR